MKSKPGQIIHKHIKVIVDHKTFPYTICGLKRSFQSISVPWIVRDRRKQFSVIIHTLTHTDSQIPATAFFEDIDELTTVRLGNFSLFQ